MDNFIINKLKNNKTKSYRQLSAPLGVSGIGGVSPNVKKLGLGSLSVSERHNARIPVPVPASCGASASNRSNRMESQSAVKTKIIRTYRQRDPNYNKYVKKNLYSSSSM